MMIPLVLSIISLCLCVLCFFFFRWYIGKKTAARELLADYRAEVHRLIAEIDAATDRDSLLVEERIKTLRKLLDDTDRRISVYMRELQRSRAGEAMYTNLGRGIRAALDSRPQPETTSQDLPTSLETVSFSKPASSAETVSLAETAPPVEPEPSVKPEPSRAAPVIPAGDTMPPAGKRNAKKRKNQASPDTAKPKLKEQIATMSEQGFSPQKIASRLKISLAEVDLALNLMNRSADF